MENRTETIYDVVLAVARERSADVGSIEGSQKLVEHLGLRSLDLARIIAKLDLKLEADPFTNLVPVTSIRTVDDLCAAYDRYLTESKGQTATADSTTSDSTTADSTTAAAADEHVRDRAQARRSAATTSQAQLRKSARKA